MNFKDHRTQLNAVESSMKELATWLDNIETDTDYVYQALNEAVGELINLVEYMPQIINHGYTSEIQPELKDIQKELEKALDAVGEAGVAVGKAHKEIKRIQ